MCVTNEQLQKMEGRSTITAMNGLREELNDKVKDIKEMLSEIYPHIKGEIDRDKAYDIVKADVAKGSGYMKWVAASMVATGIVTGYLQTWIKLFLGIK